VAGEKITRYRAHSARNEDPVEGEVLPALPLNRNFNEKSSGGETRTLNLAEALNEDPEQH
jgi:hypothetical protein